MSNTEIMKDAPVTENTGESEFLTKNITGLFWKYTLFALAGLVAQCAGVVADGMFIGNGVGEMGLAAIGVVATLMTFTAGFFLLFAIGSSTLAGIKLGNGEVEEAKNVYGSTLTFTAIISIAMAVLALIFVEPLLTALGATATILPYAKAYAVPFLIGFPFCVVGNTAYSFTRLAERPLMGSISYIVPCVVGAMIEYLMIFKFGFGVEASAYFYWIGVGGTIFLVPYLQCTGTIFKLRKTNLKVNPSYIWSSVKIGFPMFCIQGSALVITIIINHQIIKYGGNDLHIAAFGVFNAYIVYVLNVFTNAFITGMQPIISYNTGAGAHGRIRQIIKTGIVQSSIVIIVVMLIVYFAAYQIVPMFTGPVPELIEITVNAMRVFILLYALGNVSQLVAGYYIAVEKNGLAILNAISRVIIFAVPLLYIMPAIFGLDGVWMAQPGADLCACILALICIVYEYRRLGKLENERLE